MKKSVFITEYVGLSARLETLALAFMISDYFGHEVCIDWHEIDALNIVGVQHRSRGLLGRIDSVKLRADMMDNFKLLGHHRNINLRTHHGSQHLLERYYLPTGQRVKLRPDLIDVIRNTFARYANRPLVGVHIRRGDFPLISQTEFDANACVWPAVPDWWYEHVMAEIQKAVPDVAFYVSCSGSLDAFPNLRKNFDVFMMPAASPYGYKGQGHQSSTHPAVDLFALACCRLLVGSSCSTFTHYPAHMLGGPTTVLIPPSYKIYPDDPHYCRIDQHGRGAAAWLAACRTGEGAIRVTDAANLPIARGAAVDWM